MMGKTYTQVLMQKIRILMGISVVSGSHPLTLLDNNPIIVKNSSIPYTVYILLMKQ